MTALAIPHLCDAARVVADIAVLDVAAGPGALAVELARRGARAIGVDLSPGMIAMAKRLYPRADFQVADVEHLPFEDGAFDAVLCNFAMLAKRAASAITASARR